MPMNPDERKDGSLRNPIDPPQRQEEEIIRVAGSGGMDDISRDGEIVDTQDDAGRTYQPQKAVEEGLSYTPPRDPATVPSKEDPQGSEIAAGFAPSMEDAQPNVRDVPPTIDEADLAIEQKIGVVLRYDSETAHLTDVSPLVTHGVVSLYGTVPTRGDLGHVYEIVSKVDGVERVINHLEVADLEAR